MNTSYDPARPKPGWKHSLRRRCAAAAAAAAAAALTMTASPTASASVTVSPEDTARVNGTVYAVAQVGDRTIIGGDFTTVGGRPRQHVAALRPNGTLDTSFVADTDGTVFALAGSQDGSTVYVGGAFSTVNGTARANLAAVAAAGGATVPNWVADTTGVTPEVLALHVNGDRLYAGGRFGGIDGTERKRIVAIGATSGDVVKSFRPSPNPAAVKVIRTSPSGDLVYAGGAFDTIGGQSRPAGVAALHAATGLAAPFDTGGYKSRVITMGVNPAADRLYFGVEDNRVFAYDTTTSARLWTVKNSGDTQAIAASGTEIYLGGHFSQNTTQKIKRRWAMSLNLDGTVTGWDPKLSGGSMGVWALEATPTALLVGGEFTHIDGANRPRFAKFLGRP